MAGQLLIVVIVVLVITIVVVLIGTVDVQVIVSVPFQEGEYVLLALAVGVAEPEVTDPVSVLTLERTGVEELHVEYPENVPENVPEKLVAQGIYSVW